MSVLNVCEVFATPTYGELGRKTPFNLPHVTRLLLQDVEFQQAAPTVARLEREIASAKVVRYVMQALVRHALFIQLVKNDITTTWYEVRWTDKMPDADPRKADVSDCMDLLETGANLVLTAWRTPAGRTVLEGLSQKGTSKDGLPIDYIERHAAKMHLASNIQWLPAQLSIDLVKQRSFLLEANKNPYSRVFLAAYSKLQVKTYLSDRVLTGDHKTNRELRWETHPRSVHFALRKDCMEIERVLVSQLCLLHEMPQDLRMLLIAHGLRTDGADEQLCPVTLDPLKWSEFADEMSKADHGRSAFQVGHLNPLKAINDNSTFGHTAKNVSWISMDGNRIQGHLSIHEVQALLARIAANYADRARRESVLPENK